MTDETPEPTQTPSSSDSSGGSTPDRTGATSGTPEELAAGAALLEELGDEPVDGADELEASEPDIPWEDVVRMLLEFANAFLEERGELGRVLRFSDAEKNTLAIATGPVCRKYFGSAASIEATCAAAWAGYIATRYVLVRSLRAEPRQAEEVKTPKPPTPSEPSPHDPPIASTGPFPNGNI